MNSEAPLSAESENQLKDTLRLFVKNFVSFQDDEWEVFKSKTQVQVFQKGEIIEAFNSSVTKLHFVIEGFARHYFLDADSNEVTIWLSEPGGLSTDYAAFTRGDQTQYQIQAITPLTSVSITNAELDELYDRYKVVERLGRLFNQQYLNDFIDRNNFLISYSAKERYEILMTNKPHLFNIVPLKHLATYLNVTSETLSRLRAQKY